MIRIPPNTENCKRLSSQVVSAMGRIQWQAVEETNPVRAYRLARAWERLNRASQTIANHLGYLYCKF